MLLVACAGGVSQKDSQFSNDRPVNLPRIAGVSDRFMFGSVIQAILLPCMAGVDGRYFVDDAGRVMLFHGFNDVGEETSRKGQP